MKRFKNNYNYMIKKCLYCGVEYKAKGTRGKYCCKDHSDKGNDAGRKPFDGKDIDEIIKKCEEVWAIGGTDGEASYFADVSKSALGRFIKRNPHVARLRERLLEKPILLARQSVLREIVKDGALALKYLERKRSAEFNTRIVNDDLGRNAEIDELKRKLKNWENEDVKSKHNTERPVKTDE